MGWAARLCCSWLSLREATQISHGRNYPLEQQSVKIKNKNKNKNPLAQQNVKKTKKLFKIHPSSADRHVYWGEYPLGFAACLGQEECVRLLLAKGADPNVQDTNGNTVMHMLVIHDSKVSS